MEVPMEEVKVEVEKAMPDTNSNAGMDMLKAELAAAKAELMSVKAELDKSKAEAGKLVSEANARILKSEVMGALKALGVIKPEHAFKLLRDELEMIGDKIVKKGQPEVDFSVVIKEWIEGEGKYMLPPSIPAGGVGVRSVASAPASEPSLDLNTLEGATAFARKMAAGV